MRELQGLRGAPLLEKLDQHWQKYEIMLRWLKNFFAYLDRFFIKQESVDDLRTKGTPAAAPEPLQELSLIHI